MIFAELESLLQQNKYTLALQLIKDELTKSFDFSDPEQKASFDQLNDYLSTTQELILSEVYNSPQKETKDSSKLTLNLVTFIGSAITLFGKKSKAEKITSKPSTKLIPENILTKKYFEEGYKRIKIERSGYEYIERKGENIVVLMTPINDKNTQTIFGIDENWIKNSRLGEYAIRTGNQNLRFHILNAISNYKYYDHLEILKGFTALMNSVCELNVDEVNIFLVTEGITSSNDFLRSQFMYFLIHINYILAAKPKMHIKILLKEPNIKVDFERTIILFKQPTNDNNVLVNYSKEKVNRLAKNALTQDEKYISQLDSLARIINEDIPILLLGETGVGKTWLAKIIHNESVRNQKAFEEQNCGGILPERLEPNLYGWRKGSFTGAIGDKKGKVTLAEGGTLFLDEIHRTDTLVRNSLLTFIENKKYTVLGAESPTIANVRLLFGTNEDLQKLIMKKAFEEDFYYRISSRKITIPPLRNRINDIEIITNFTIDNLCREKEKIVEIENAAIELLKEYSWPGNTRELTSYIRNIFIDCISYGSNIISAKMIQETPFENHPHTKSEDLDALEELLKKFLDNWDITKGDIQHELIAPIIAKLYIEDSFNHWNKTKKYESAMKVVGMGGKGFNDSTLQKFYDQYPNIRKILGLED